MDDYLDLMYNLESESDKNIYLTLFGLSFVLMPICIHFGNLKVK